MNVYAGTLGQLVIVELFVLWIWFQVLLDTMRDKSVTDRQTRTSYNKLFLTSLGLVLNSIAISGIMVVRAIELVAAQTYILPIVAFYVLLAVAAFLLILSASIGTSTRLVKVFVAVTVIWTAYIAFFGIF